MKKPPQSPRAVYPQISFARAMRHFATQSALARWAGVSRQAVSCWKEAGKVSHLVSAALLELERNPPAQKFEEVTMKVPEWRFRKPRARKSKS